MQTEFYISGVSEKYVQFILKNILKKDIACIATAKRNLRGDKVNIFDTEFDSQISIHKGQRFLVVGGEEWDCGALKRALFPLRPTIYQAEEILCQTKWKGQPYKFFFKDSAISN